ncbi:MAG: CBS domain-containing protein, partial [candidate division NC10 bacterium]
LVGIVTDGDLRRVHLRDVPILSLRARECMTRSPKLIGRDELAAKALQVLESFAITSLVIVDEAHRPVGIIHMHDILRAKIV